MGRCESRPEAALELELGRLAVSSDMFTRLVDDSVDIRGDLSYSRQLRGVCSVVYSKFACVSC